MFIKGIKCRKSRTLGYRISIAGDLDLSGNQVNKHHLSFVKIKDCTTYTKNGKQYYNPNDPKAKSIRINHGGTWYGYGKARRINKLENIFIETRFYAVNSGSVYTGVIRKRTTEEILIKEERIKKLKKILENV